MNASVNIKLCPLAMRTPGSEIAESWTGAVKPSCLIHWKLWPIIHLPPCALETKMVSRYVNVFEGWEGKVGFFLSKIG